MLSERVRDGRAQRERMERQAQRKKQVSLFFLYFGRQEGEWAGIVMDFCSFFKKTFSEIESF